MGDSVQCASGSSSAHHPRVSSGLRSSDVDEEEAVEAPRPAKKERSSWDFEADDSFKFESGGPIPEPEKPPDPPPIFAPPFVRNKNDFRAKLIHLSELTLTLPPSPTGPEPPDAPNESDQGQSPQDIVAGDAPPLTCRRKPPRPTFARSKTRTRLQDPPPMTPAVSDQLASIWSDAGRSSRRGSLIHQPVEDERQAARFGPVTSRRVSSTMNNFEGDQIQMPRGSRKSVTMSVTDAAAAAAGSPTPAPPAAAPSRLGMFSPSAIFSPSRLGLLSKSKANLVQPPPEEEVDPLDDDSIPNYKKLKSKERRWLVWIQWIGLFILILVMILAIKMNKLQLVVWKEIQLWQWLALATVIISGRLIAGWLVMVRSSTMLRAMSSLRVATNDLTPLSFLSFVLMLTSFIIPASVMTFLYVKLAPMH
ncbi:hypothetical protein Mapa_003930 [Marchantia paleacea]|nr:hypothetical protein Mapa_003930 [Marchantia paleacea]